MTNHNVRIVENEGLHVVQCLTCRKSLAVRSNRAEADQIGRNHVIAKRGSFAEPSRSKPKTSAGQAVAGLILAAVVVVIVLAMAAHHNSSPSTTGGELTACAKSDTYYQQNGYADPGLLAACNSAIANQP